MYRKIMVHLDGTRYAERILPGAIRLARKHEAKLVLLGIIKPPERAAIDPPARRFIQAASGSRERLEPRLKRYLQIVAMYLGISDVDAEPVVVEGEGPEEIWDRAKEYECDLVALLDNDFALLAHGPLAGVADASLRTLDPPLLLISPDGYDDPAGLSTPMLFGAGR